ncbi:hypothetical protein AVEN_269033-1 [Araneus ventricosus]|uniref:Uncharacterized protein n=1 Tax=Araneus ventricosus TaxID=182803 RepID=A0A4Y2LCC5_ARAVE|nr:hypothetical protein AVEN_269033-1 [Araneus ventricosus]
MDKTYQEGIRQSPYEAMFGIKPKRGITSSFFLANKLQILKPKNNSKKLLILLKPKQQLEETVNTFEENLSHGHTENHTPKRNIEEHLQPTTSSYQALNEQHEFISIKKIGRERESSTSSNKMLRTSKKKKFVLLKLVRPYEYKSSMSTVVVQMAEMCWHLLLE